MLTPSCLSHLSTTVRSQACSKRRRLGLAPHARHLPAGQQAVAVIGASTSMFGAVWAQAELRKALGLAGARVLDQELAVPTAHEAFNDDGRLARGATRRRLREVLAQLVTEAEPVGAAEKAPAAPDLS
jgi:NAD(P)H-dependent FMN reductase